MGRYLYSVQKSSVVSSAKISMSDLIMSFGRSLMNSRNRVGPRRDPCGTPALIGWASDDCPLTTTLSDLLVRKDLTTEKVLPVIP